jgi:GNAT superfamily N-acetyltransferase
LSNVTIKEVKTKAERRVFVDFPNRLYRDNENFVPAFFGDDMADWDEKKNPAFEYCEARSWLAYKNDQVVGRIGAILSYASNEKWGTKRMRFSQVDFIDDREVSKALFDTAENWAREKGMEEMHGPLGFCDLDREGMLVEGFDKRSMFITYYNEPYYIDHLTELGYEKDVDWVENLIPLGDNYSETYKRLKRISDVMLRRTGFRKVDVSKRSDVKPYVRKAFDLINVAYAHLYGTVELNERQIDKYTNKFLPLIDPDFCCLLVDDKDDLMGFAVAAPSMAEAMKKSRGRLFPTGWIGVLRSLKKNDTLDLFLIAIRPELRGSGVNGILMEHIYKGCIKHGIMVAETGPQLETNTKVQNQWKMFGPAQHKRRRCFKKTL